MLTQEQITHIMHELGLDTTDQSARNTIERLAASKPDAPIDSTFIAQLREDLAHRANQFNLNKHSNKNNYFISFMNKFLVGALVVMIVLVAGGLWYIQGTNKPLLSLNQSSNNGSGSEENQILSGEYGVKSVSEESFGNLDKVAIVAGGRGSTNYMPTTAGSGSAESIAAYQLEQQKLAAGSPAAGQSVSDTSMIWPGPSYNFDFKYEGTALTNLADTQAVLKRAKPVQEPSLVSRIINMISFGLIDMSKFQSIRLQNFAFLEDREFGYGLNVDIQSGMVSIYQNWEKWPQTQPSCLAIEICPPQNPLTIDQLPSNTEAIEIANAFLADYSISKEGYGTPVIQDSWRIYYERAEDKRNYYVPEQVQVIYPLQLEGKQVYDEGGQPAGMMVLVDARTKRVITVSDLITKQFEKSEYKGETNAQRIIDIAEKGGFRNYAYAVEDANNVKKTTLILDTPTVQMVKVWYSADNYRTNNELYMPAMVFPVKNWEQAGYYRPNVIVPLVRSILDSDNQQGRPIPLDATSSSSPAQSMPVGQPVKEPTDRIIQ